MGTRCPYFAEQSICVPLRFRAKPTFHLRWNVAYAIFVLRHLSEAWCKEKNLENSKEKFRNSEDIEWTFGDTLIFFLCDQRFGHDFDIHSQIYKEVII